MSIWDTWDLRKEIEAVLRDEINNLNKQIKNAEKEVDKLQKQSCFLSGIHLDNASYVVHLKSKEGMIDFAYTGTITDAITNAKKELNEKELDIKISILLNPAVYPLPKEYLYPLPEKYYKSLI